MKGQDKIPEKQLNGKDKTSSRKRIHNNDSEGDPGSQGRMQAKIEKIQ